MRRSFVRAVFRCRLLLDISAVGRLLYIHAWIAFASSAVSAFSSTRLSKVGSLVVMRFIRAPFGVSGLERRRAIAASSGSLYERFDGVRPTWSAGQAV